MLQFLENDLIALNEMNKQHYKSVERVIDESPLGLFARSEIGHAMRLYYYLSPQELVNGQSMRIDELSEAKVLKSEMGSYVKIALENFKGSTFKLPDCSLINAQNPIEM